MCESCGCSTAMHVPPASRRPVLKFAVAAVASLAIPSITYGETSSSESPPKPAHLLSPNAAFVRHMAVHRSVHVCAFNQHH